VERKLATVLFVDLVDSTSLLAGSDPEVVRRKVSRYFECASERIQLHGGTVEKFAGDAVMAAFGVPQAHEDDAERAVRAAFDVLDAVHELGLQARAGIESGEVVVDNVDSTFATGEAVNVAARLQQSALPGAIALGPVARRLTVGSIDVEDAGPVEIRPGEETWSWRVLRVLDMRRRRPKARFVGRQHELELLHNSYDRAVRDRRTTLVTVFGDPGVGKTRLVEEFTAGVERATVLTGRALPYGEGVAFWPIASMVRRRPGSPTPTLRLRRSRSSGSRARAKRWPTCSASRWACSARRTTAQRRWRPAGPRCAGQSSWPTSNRSCSSSKTSTGPTSGCST
jgi:class 3 adenylate cyclase